MFFQVYSAALVLALPLLAAASPASVVARSNEKPAPAGPITNQCNTGNVNCCNQLQKASDSGLTGLLTLVGVALTDPQVLLGVGCNPVSVFGGGLGSSCTANPVCCKQNPIGGLIGVGCVPLQLSA